MKRNKKSMPLAVPTIWHDSTSHLEDCHYIIQKFYEKEKENRVSRHPVSSEASAAWRSSSAYSTTSLDGTLLFLMMKSIVWNIHKHLPIQVTF
jgi:hypothetical protein